MSKYKISFADDEFDPVELPEQANLSEYLTVQNSPILFGCRIGICGTCLVEIITEDGSLNERTENEREFLEAVYPEEKKCRLACQVNLNTNIKVKKIEL
ncbi:MAG: (2Fe-2S)-binding protein [Bdellovibrionaceae bacterium]|nr:(2Fe-2S)-binding protein [Pseudobdellovibrionaceae bacterium]